MLVSIKTLERLDLSAPPFGREDEEGLRRKNLRAYVRSGLEMD